MNERFNTKLVLTPDDRKRANATDTVYYLTVTSVFTSTFSLYTFVDDGDDSFYLNLDRTEEGELL